MVEAKVPKKRAVPPFPSQLLNSKIKRDERPAPDQGQVIMGEYH